MPIFFQYIQSETIFRRELLAHPRRGSNAVKKRWKLDEKLRKSAHKSPGSRFSYSVFFVSGKGTSLKYIWLKASRKFANNFRRAICTHWGFSNQYRFRNLQLLSEYGRCLKNRGERGPLNRYTANDIIVGNI